MVPWFVTVLVRKAARSTETMMNSNSPSVLLQHEWMNKWENAE